MDLNFLYIARIQSRQLKKNKNFVLSAEYKKIPLLKILVLNLDELIVPTELIFVGILWNGNFLTHAWYKA